MVHVDSRFPKSPQMRTQHAPRWAKYIAVVSIPISASLAGPIAPASAHTILKDSDPAAGSKLAQIPSSVKLDFNEAIGTQFATVSVMSPEGKQTVNNGATVTGSTVTAALDPTTVPGIYAVSYRVVSADGHPVTGQFKFELVA